LSQRPAGKVGGAPQQAATVVITFAHWLLEDDSLAPLAIRAALYRIGAAFKAAENDAVKRISHIVFEVDAQSFNQRTFEAAGWLVADDPKKMLYAQSSPGRRSMYCIMGLR
jgi:hypothetical protein